MPSLYGAAGELAWYIREDNSVEGVACLRGIVEPLRALRRKWRVAGKLTMIW